MHKLDEADGLIHCASSILAKVDAQRYSSFIVVLRLLVVVWVVVVELDDKQKRWDKQADEEEDNHKLEAKLRSSIPHDVYC